MAGELERGPGPGALPDPDSVVIPDDPSALEGDMWALRAELTRRQRKARRSRPGTSRSRAALLGRLGPMLFGSLLLVAFLASLATIVRPTTTEPTQPSEIASVSAAEGAVGGLLPQAVVTLDGTSVALQTVRPAVIVWLAEAGAEPAVLASLKLQANSYGLPLVLAGSSEQAELLERTEQTVGSAGSEVLVDPQGSIPQAIDASPTAPSVVVVGTDGRIHAVVEDPSAGTRLESVLSRAAAGADPIAQ